MLKLMRMGGNIIQPTCSENRKPLKGFGSGVFEIVENYRGETYRVVYALQVGVPIYILHVFQKKSTKGIKTPKKEIEVIRQRLKMAQEREYERSTI